MVSTPDEVMLCALARKGDKLHVVPTRYTLPTDSIPIVSLCGLPNGRIFMGGYDGSLYEFAYENLVSNAATPVQKTQDQRLKDYYDGTATSIKMNESAIGVATRVLKGSKRAFASMMSGEQRPHKCRKLNHTASGFSAVATSVVPDWLLKAPAALFGSVKTGPLEKIVHDAERHCLYTLTARGFVGVYDLRPKELVMKATIDCDKVARQYLSAVAKGHMFCSSSSIEFSGGGSAAQAGVGGMDGARSVLKLADADAKTKLLTPVSLHVLPRSDSSRLTLLAVTAGGLRYYLTSLSSSLNKSNLAPSSRMTMCHIRSPPPVDPTTGQIKESFEEGDVAGGMRPSLLPQTSVDAAAYSDGHLFLALQRPQRNGSAATKEVGNIIVGTNADYVARKVTKRENATIRELPGGVAETVSLPTDLLPGGRIIDATSVGFSRTSPLMKLMLNSQTPSDGELGVGLVPPFYPKIASKKKEGKKKDDKKTASTSSADVARSTALVKVPTTASTISGGAIVVQVLSNFLLSRPLGQGITFQSGLKHSEDGARTQQYRISNRCGAAGFSNTAGGKVSSSVSVGKSSTHLSPRLSPWLLRPAVVPLNEMTMNHILPETKTVAVSVGGIHWFKGSTALTTLADRLMAAGPNVAQDAGVTEFFNNYDAKEFCTLCLMLAIGCGPARGTGNVAEELKNRAYKASFGRGSVPRLTKKLTEENGHASFVVQETPLIPQGYDFKPSHLSEGVCLLAARLLRPIWCKPAVVVTEGQTVKMSGSLQKTLQAKVELLLDEKTLDEVRTPIFKLKKLMEKLFHRAVAEVPGVRKDSNRMDIDETNVFTGGMLFQGAMRLQGSSQGVLSREEAVATARLIEELNLHSLYRLISRTVQLLDLLSLMKRAQYMSDLPEVEWGLLHGLTVAQLVMNAGGQERTETLLNSLVSKTKVIDGANVAPSADADTLANQLETQCYLFFSPGSRFSYLGFRSANEALSCMKSSGRRRNLSKKAVEHFKMAAKCWTSPQLVTGRMMHTERAETYDQKVNIALQYDSPLAQAAAALLKIDELIAIVDICAITAANFRGTPDSHALLISDNNGFAWEKTLYHHRKSTGAAQGTNGSSSSASSPNAFVSGASVTDQDVISTCHAIILHHLVAVLKGSYDDVAKRDMVAACAASSDKAFLTAFFDYLLTTKNESTLLKINSPDLEKWLGEREDPQLMWRYYFAQHKQAEAGELMWNQATNLKPTLSIEQRIIFLERSQNAYNSAIHDLANPMIQSAGIDAAELKSKCTRAGEYLDVARLQQQTLIEVRSLGLQLEKELLQALEMTLVLVSDLFNEYTAPLNLYEMSLRILHSCRHQDTALIETLWKSVICQEILPCSTNSEATYNFLLSLMPDSTTPEEVAQSVVLLSGENGNGEGLPLFESGSWLEKVRSRVTRLGRELFGQEADYVCPVGFLVTSMEGECTC